MIDAMREVELFFDGACPLCAREVRFLRRLDAGGRVLFTDISDPAFDARALGKRPEDLMASLHARLPDGSWLDGVNSFRAVYSAVGLGPLVAVSRLPGIAWALDRAYALFAKNRLRLTGRCADGACDVRRSPGPVRLREHDEGSLARRGTSFEVAGTGGARAADREVR